MYRLGDRQQSNADFIYAADNSFDRDTGQLNRSTLAWLLSGVFVVGLVTTVGVSLP